MSGAATTQKKNARTRLLDAALSIIRQKGYAGTSVDELCAAASVTKGAFFHHFASKEELGAAAAEYWSCITDALFTNAPYHQPDDPLDRVLAYIDFRASLIEGPIEAFTCLAGTLVQETYSSSEAMRRACDCCITGHAATLEADIEAAMDLYGTTREITAQSLALYTQAALQGGFVLAKARGEAGPAKESVAHLKNYIQLLFSRYSTP